MPVPIHCARHQSGADRCCCADYASAARLCERPAPIIALTRRPNVPLGRNDICDCGSGKKYKKCCGGVSAPVAEPDSNVSRANAVKRADQTLDDHLLRFAKKHGGAGWLARAISEYLGYEDADADSDLIEGELQLVIPWVLYHYHSAVGDVPMAHQMREAQGARLSPELRQLLDAQLQAWLSVWEVLAVRPGVGMTLKDLLTGEQRFVYEVSGTKGLVARDALLARVVDCNGVSFMAGLYPRVLPPNEADLVVRDLRRVCRVRTKPVKVEKLRDVNIQLELLDRWRMGVEEMDQPKPLPTLCNTDGDLLMLTTDHFEIVADHVGDVTEQLARLTGAGQPLEEDGETVIVVTRPGNAKINALEVTVIGRLVIAGTLLKAETNSTRRADALRLAIETQLRERVRHRMRDESSPAALMNSALAASPSRVVGRPEVIPPEFKAIARQMKESHMMGWVDEQIPALGGLTPREAAATPRSRVQLDLLLRDFENHEARLPEDERFDMRRVRGVLGMEG